MVVAVTGCGSSFSAGAGGGARTVGVTEQDFEISTTTAHVPVGAVTLRIHNQGPDEHELIVPRGAGAVCRSERTALRSTRRRSRIRSLARSTPSSLGGTEYLSLHLAAGRYVLFCNMEGHYMGGMHTVLVVR